jgi:hypothetical protein
MNKTFDEFTEEYSEILTQETGFTFDRTQLILDYIQKLETRIRWLEAKTKVLKDIVPEEL